MLYVLKLKACRNKLSCCDFAIKIVKPFGVQNTLSYFAMLQKTIIKQIPWFDGINT